MLASTRSEGVSEVLLGGEAVSEQLGVQGVQPPRSETLASSCIPRARGQTGYLGVYSGLVQEYLATGFAFFWVVGIRKCARRLRKENGF